nr:MAG TPA: hypothetical protein [Caudoviricetes sp.]
MDWEQLGYMLGHAGTMSWAQNYFNRGLDKARDRLAGITDPSGEERRRAQAMADKYYGNGLLGQNPATHLLQAKRDWMQADNDAQYLLNNGYAEDSPDVQKFREIQAKAHASADEWRGIGKSMGLDLSRLGAGMNLSELKGEVNRSIAPMMYQKYPDMQEQMMQRNAWAGQTARNILGGMVGQGTEQIIPRSGASLQTGAVPQAASPAPAVSVQPVTGTEPMTPPSGQLGGYSPQGRNLLNFDPNAGFGMEGTANPTLPGQNDSLGRAISGADVFKYLQDRGVIPKERTYAEEVEEIAKAFAQQRAAKMSDREIRQYLKDNGVPSNIAKIVMAERTQQMQEQMKKNALAQAAAASSSPQMAYLIAAAAADSNMKVSDLAGLINATNPDLRLDTIDLGGTKVAMTHDTKGRVRGGVQVLPVTISPKDLAGLQYNYDKLGADIDMENQKNAWQYYNTDTVAATSRQNSQRQAQAQLDAAKIRGEYGLEEAKMRGERTGSSGGRSGAQQGGGLKPNEALNILKQAQMWDEDHPGEEWANPLADARDKALVVLNEYDNVDPDNKNSVYSFGQNILEQNARDGFPYTVEQLKQIIRSVGGELAEQAAEDLLSGEGRKYGRDG